MNRSMFFIIDGDGIMKLTFDHGRSKIEIHAKG
jgi:hypothetical protein